MGDETLKPCPFCGSGAQAFESAESGWWMVECDWCDARSPDRATKTNAAKSWNERPEHDRIRAEAAAEERARIVMWLRASAEENRRAADTFRSVSVQMEARAHECESRAEGIELGEHLDPDAFPKPGSAT